MNYLSWRHFRGRKIHLMKYEDLIEDPKKNFIKMLEYINSIISINIAQNRISKAVEDTAFHKLQKLEDIESLIFNAVSGDTALQST